MRLITTIKLECALFEVRTVIVRDQLEQEFSFGFESIVRGHYVYKGALIFVNATFPLLEYRHAMC